MWKATYDLVAQVPMGRVTTYGAVAKALGDVVASRFVGLAMSMNDDIVRVPCRRVVQTDGRIGGYTGGGPEKKAHLLRSEGVDVTGGRIADMERYFFDDFKSHHPLKNLRKRQLLMKRGLKLSRERGSEFEKVAGIDVAYKGHHAFSAMVVLDMGSGVEVARAVDEVDTRFPYIPTYLAFREIPVIRRLMQDLDSSTVVMYDGNGILHPNGFGIASQVGIEFGIPTIGVAKKLLCGTATGRWRGNAREIRVDGALAGHVLRSPSNKKGVFVSAGHMISSEEALNVTSRCTRHRVPEPTRMAHIAAESARRGTRNK